MIKSFMHYFVASQQRELLAENIQSFNSRVREATGSQFREFIERVRDPRHTFVKVMKYNRNEFSIYNVRNEFGYVNGGVMFEYSAERTDEIPLQLFIDDFTAIVQHDYSIDIPVKCFNSNDQNNCKLFSAIYDDQSNVIFIVVDAPSYDMAEDDISNCVNFVNNCIGSKNVDDETLATAATVIVEGTAPDTVYEPNNTVLKHIVKFFSSRYLQDHPALRQSINDYLNANQQQDQQDNQQQADAQQDEPEQPDQQQNQQDDQQNAQQDNQQQDDAHQDEPEQDNQQNGQQQYRTLNNGIRYAGVWNADDQRTDEFNIVLTKAQNEEEFITYMQSLQAGIASCFAEKPVKMKHIDFNSNNTLIKRLYVIMFSRQNAMTFYTSTNGHPMVLQINASQQLFERLNSIPADVWHKYFWKEWRTAFDRLQSGVMVLFDRDRYFNRKHNLQAECPFAIGKQVAGPGHVSDEGHNGNDQQNAQDGNGEQQQQQQRQRQPRRQQVAQDTIAAVDTAVKEALRQSGNDDIDVELAINRGHRPRGCPRDNFQYFVVKFPGMLDDVFVGDQAVEFLRDLDMWENVIQPSFDAASQQFENIKLCVTLKNPL